MRLRRTQSRAYFMLTRTHRLQSPIILARLGLRIATTLAKAAKREFDKNYTRG